VEMTVVGTDSSPSCHNPNIINFELSRYSILFLERSFPHPVSIQTQGYTGMQSLARSICLPETSCQDGIAEKLVHIEWPTKIVIRWSAIARLVPEYFQMNMPLQVDQSRCKKSDKKNGRHARRLFIRLSSNILLPLFDQTPSTIVAYLYMWYLKRSLVLICWQFRSSSDIFHFFRHAIGHLRNLVVLWSERSYGFTSPPDLQISDLLHLLLILLSIVRLAIVFQ